MRILAAAAIGGFAVIALPLAASADTERFTAQLTADADTAAKPGAPHGSASLSLDTATKTVSWTIEYAGLSGAVREVTCGALDSLAGPPLRLTSNLASPITGSKALSDPEIAGLAAGRWVCVIESANDEAEIGGVLQPAR